MNTTRRMALRGIGLVGLGGALWLAGWASPRAALAADDRAAFEVRRLREAFDVLGITDPEPSDGLRLDAPDFADNAAFVPLEIENSIAEARTLAVFVERNPYPYVARFEVADGGLPYLMLRVRVAETSPVRIVAGNGTSHHVATREIRVVAGGCAGDPGMPPEAASTPPEPIRIRARAVPGGADLRVLMRHPMENGLRQDASGQTLPAHYIQRVTVELNGKPVVRAQFGRSVSTDPLFGLRLPGAREGDSVAVEWVDSRGESRRDEATVTA